MKKLSLFLCLTTAILLIFTNSCKKDQLVSFNTGSTGTQNAVSQLPVDKLVKPEEVSNWVQQTFGSSINPIWSKEMQSVVNGNHVIELPISNTTALFFTKVNGVLDVYGYKWMDRKPGANVFTGGVSYFSFQTHIMQVSVYVDGKLNATKGFDLTPPSTAHSSSPVIINSLNATSSTLPLAAPKKLADADGGPGEWIAMLACWISGGNWMGGYGANGCNFLNQGQSWIGSIFSSISNFIGGAIESIFGGGGGGGDDDNTSNNTNNGFSYVGSDGTTITIDGSSIASGGMAYVTVNQPCTPGGPSDGGDGTTQTTQDSFSTDPNGCTGGGSAAQWLPIGFAEPDPITPPSNNDSNTDDTDGSGNVVNTDCSSFIFTKTSVANWQEAGVNNIRLAWVWIGNTNNGLSRTLYMPPIVFGLPTQYQNSNGSIIYQSAGQAAVKAAEITEIAKQFTYREFRSSPFWPTDTEVISYFKKQLATLMASQRGTAGVTGSGSSAIVFKDEERSTFFPYSCGN